MMKFNSTAQKVILALCCVTLLLLLVLGTFFFKIYRVSHSSMSNTFIDGDRVLVKVFDRSEINRNDILVFAHLDARYIKRCVAIAGDTLQISDWKVRVNSERPETSGTLNLPRRDSGRVAEKPYHMDTQAFDISVFQEYHQYWNLKNFGPYIVPKCGMVVGLNADNIKRYGSIITREVGKPAFQSMISNRTKWYRFQADYYFMIGDNRPRSTDSRSFGGIRKEQVIGKVIYQVYKHRPA